jgi:hypothetical protein
VGGKEECMPCSNVAVITDLNMLSVGAHGEVLRGCFSLLLITSLSYISSKLKQLEKD